MNIEKLKEYTKEKHKGQLRKQGTPYYYHPLAVSELLKASGFDINYQIAGLFHDLLEDTDATKEDLESISNRHVVDVVDLLTKEENYNMDDYIFRIKNNEMAKAVKLADRIHNLEETNLASIEFQKKYILETKKYYVDLAKGTIFEDKLNMILKKLEDEIKQVKYEN